MDRPKVPFVVRSLASKAKGQVTPTAYSSTRIRSLTMKDSKAPDTRTYLKPLFLVQRLPEATAPPATHKESIKDSSPLFQPRKSCKPPSESFFPLKGSDLVTPPYTGAKKSNVGEQVGKSSIVVPVSAARQSNKHFFTPPTDNCGKKISNQAIKKIPALKTKPVVSELISPPTTYPRVSYLPARLASRQSPSLTATPSSAASSNSAASTPCPSPSMIPRRKFPAKYTKPVVTEELTACRSIKALSMEIKKGPHVRIQSSQKSGKTINLKPTTTIKRSDLVTRTRKEDIAPIGVPKVDKSQYKKQVIDIEAITSSTQATKPNFARPNGMDAMLAELKLAQSRITNGEMALRPSTLNTGPQPVKSEETSHKIKTKYPAEMEAVLAELKQAQTKLKAVTRIEEGSKDTVGAHEPVVACPPPNSKDLKRLLPANIDAFGMKAVLDQLKSVHLKKTCERNTPQVIDAGPIRNRPTNVGETEDGTTTEAERKTQFQRALANAKRLRQLRSEEARIFAITPTCASCPEPQSDAKVCSPQIATPYTTVISPDNNANFLGMSSERETKDEDEERNPFLEELKSVLAERKRTAKSPVDQFRELIASKAATPLAVSTNFIQRKKLLESSKTPCWSLERRKTSPRKQDENLPPSESSIATARPRSLYIPPQAAGSVASKDARIQTELSRLREQKKVGGRVII